MRGITGGIVTDRKRFAFTAGGTLPGIVRGCAADCGAVFSAGGLWVAPPADSGEAGTVWGRALIDVERPEKGYFRFIAAASDRDYIEHNGGRIPLERALAEYLMGGSSPVEEMSAAAFIDPSAAPLHRLKGRWLLFAVQFFPEKGQSFRLNSVELECPFRSYMEALPEVFSRTDNGNLEGLLAMYRAVTDETDRRIIGFGRRLSPELASGKDLERLLAWQGIGVTAIWEEKRLRELIKASARLVRLKGTREAISGLFTILLGEEPEIDAPAGSFSFTVTVSHSSIGSGRRYAELLRLLEDFSPAGVKPRLVVRGGGAAGDGTVLSDDSFGSGFVL